MPRQRHTIIRSLLEHFLSLLTHCSIDDYIIYGLALYNLLVRM